MSMAKSLHLPLVTAPAHTLWSIHKMSLSFNFIFGLKFLNQLGFEFFIVLYHNLEQKNLPDLNYI